MATKPTVDTSWATQLTNDGPSGNLNKQEPSTAFKNFGQPEGQPTDRQGLNFILDALHQWKNWSEESIDDLESNTSGVGTWNVVTTAASTQTESNAKYFSVTTTTSQDFVLPTPLVTGNPIAVYHAQSATSNTCRIVNNGHTLIGTSLTLSSADNLVLEKGFVAEIIPTTGSSAYIRITKVL